jgi:hypothetical protein
VNLSLSAVFPGEIFPNFRLELSDLDFDLPEHFLPGFPLRGIKDSPPYLHDGRLLTLEDVVEFFNLIQGLKLTQQEKTDLVAFLRSL